MRESPRLALQMTAYCWGLVHVLALGIQLVGAPSTVIVPAQLYSMTHLNKTPERRHCQGTPLTMRPYEPMTDQPVRSFGHYGQNNGVRRRSELVPMRMIVTITACGLLLAGCGSGSEAGPSSATTQPVNKPSSPHPAPSDRSTSPADQSTPPAPAGTGVKTATSDFGVILFDSTGQAIYLFAKERSSAPACYGPCAAAWPPVLTTAPPKALAGVKQSLLGTTKRTDGTIQVTYGGHPLYFYAHEGKNEVKCHNVQSFGGLWLAVTAAATAAPV
jgi:predicted lipoprotein with Yx(FWY)xxD motif